MSDFHPFRDMKESAKAQHEVDKANFEAAKAEQRLTGKKLNCRFLSVRRRCKKSVKSRLLKLMPVRRRLTNA